MSDAFEKVSLTEREADEIVARAKLEAVAVMERAEETAARLTDEIISAARAGAAEKMSEANEEGQKLLEQSLSELEDEKNEIIKKAAAKHEQAVKIIFDALTIN